MKKNPLMKVLAVAAFLPLCVGCDNYDTEAVEKMDKVRTYDAKFTKAFGSIDPNQDWSMATRVTANIDLSNVPEGTYEVSIFSQKDGFLLKRAILDKSAVLSFDAIKGEDAVRILARKTSALGLTVINRYFPIEQGVVNTSTGTRASSADNCETTVGEQIDLGTKVKQGELVYVYQAKNGNAGDGGSQLVTALPNNDNVYYYTKIDGQSYADGSNGNYAVTYNGQQSTMDMYEIGAIISDASKDQRYYEMTPAEYQYNAAGTIDGASVLNLPTNDNIYYIIDISGQTYNNGDNGNYAVIYNGTSTEYNMYEIGDVLTNAGQNFRYCKQAKVRVYSWSSDWKPEYEIIAIVENGNKYAEVDGYIVPYGAYILPAYYNKTKEAGYTIAGGAIHGAYYEPTSQNVTVKWGGDFYYLNDVYKSIDKETQMPFEDLLPLVSSAHPDPHFHEMDDNRVKWEDELDFNVELVLTEDGPMTYTYVFYGSIYHNMLGYFYWFEEEGMTDAEIKAARIAAPKYVLMNDTYPTIENPETGGKPNLQCYSDENGTDPHTPDGMQMPVWVDALQSVHEGHYLQGTTYHMVYFGENYDQPATYTFPEGAHVAFFLLTKATAGGSNQNNKGTGLFYSIKDMNEDQEIFLDEQGNKCILNDKHWWASEVNGEYNEGEERPDEGEVAAVFYSYKGSMVIGFEDDVDKDENDMLFFISAPVDPPLEITEESSMSWLVACEDLGDVYDYDFNDVVFDLSQVDMTTTTTSQGTSTTTVTSELYLTPLAAGGTRPSNIYWNENPDPNGTPSWKLIGEIHSLLSKGKINYRIPINVNAQNGQNVAFDKNNRIKLTDFTATGETAATDETEFEALITSILHNRIKIEREGSGPAFEITFPHPGDPDNLSDTPQMLLLPRGWDWPTESNTITNVYSDFENWVQSSEKNGWITNKKGSYITNPLK